MHLEDWIHAFEVQLTARGVLIPTVSKREMSVKCFMRSCVLSIQNRGSALDVEISFIYIVGLLTSFLDRCDTPVSEKVFVSLVSTCLYDKLTNDWPQGTVFFCHFLQCTCKSVLLDKEIAFVESLNFDLNVSRNAAEQMKESLIQIWIRYQLDHPPIPLLVSSDDSLMCEEDMSWMLL